MKIDDSYDAIVVGSGIGGLAAASLLTQLAGKRVLLLERHFKLGGFTHSFQRGQFSWDPGLHYVGDMHPGSQLRALFDLVTGGAVDWTPLPERFERFAYPDFEFRVSSDRRQYAADLKAKFPGEARSVDRYFADVHAASAWYRRHMAAKIVPGGIGRLLEMKGRRLAFTLTGDYLRANFTDPRLRALLASQWGDYGLPPAQSPFAVHALIVDHYLHGAWYPVGGAGAIAAAVRPVIEAGGGACVVNAEAEEIMVDRGRASCVRVRLGQGTRFTERTISAPLVISNAGAEVTYNRLLPATLNLREQRLVKELPHSMSAVQLFLGLDRDPREMGVQGENLFVFPGYDHDAALSSAADVIDGKPSGCFVVFPSVKDPRARAHTAEIIALVDDAKFERWAATGWKQRDEDYAALKARVTEGLLELADRHVPGLRDSVVFSELATPLSLAHFSGSRHGSCYGLAATRERLAARWLGVRTPIGGLLLSGSDAASLGIGGALMGGVLSAAKVLGPTGMMKVMRAANRDGAAAVTAEHRPRRAVRAEA